MTGRNLKYCTAPNRALIQFRVSPDPADGICAQNMPASQTVCHHLVARESRGSRTWVHCGRRQCSNVSHRGELQQLAVTCPVPLTPSTTNCKGPTAIGGCRTAKHCRSVRTAILCVACSKTQCGTQNCIHFIFNVKGLHPPPPAPPKSKLKERTHIL